MEVQEWAIVFADLAGFTALTEAHGDQDAAGLAARFYALARGCLAPPVTLVKTIGDAVMLASPDPAAAVAAARAIVAAVAAEPDFPEVRVGVHVGPAVARDGDFFGATVNLAARVASHARGGQIVGTRALLEHLPGDLPTTALGEVRFKNVSQPVAVYALETRTARTCPVCRMHLGATTGVPADRYHGTTYDFCSEACAHRFHAHPEDFVPS